MRSRSILPLIWLILLSLPLEAQQRLYPVTAGRDIPVVLSPDRSGLVADKAFRFKLTLGFPSPDSTVFIPDTDAPVVMLWLRLQNISERPIEVTTPKFMSTDDQGQSYPGLSVDDATNRIVDGFSGATSGSRTLKTLSLGRVANIPNEEEFRASVLRWSFQSGQVLPGIIKEGWIYFEKPPRKKFTVTVTLGDLSSQPLMFSTEKQK
jgi:hypothetical protein